MRIVWCTLQFLDYRIPVFEALNKIEGVELFLIFSGDINSDGIIQKTKKALGNNAIPLYGEYSIGKASTESFANSGFRIPYQKGLISKIKKLKPDVMVSDGFFQWSYATLFLRATKGIPHVMCYERTPHTERNAQKIRKKYRKFATKFIDSFCCSGKLCGEYLDTFGVKEKDKFYGFMVADTREIEKRTKEISTPDKSKILEKSKKDITTYLYVGQLIERKGILELIKAWKAFCIKSKPNAELIVVGEGHLKEELVQFINVHSLKNINLLGKVPYEKIFDYYQKADIFIMPTLEDNWSLVVPEAMAAGLPVITTIYNGCYPELVKPENGWVFDSLDKDSFVNTLFSSYKSTDKFIEMGKNSKKIISEHTPQSAAESVFKACKYAITNS